MMAVLPAPSSPTNHGGAAHSRRSSISSPAATKSNIGTSSHSHNNCTTDKPAVYRFKCVCFDNQPTLHEIPSHHDLDEEEKRSAWFTDAELGAMADTALDPASHRQPTVQKASGGDHDDNHIYRGLERYSMAGSTRLETQRVQVVAAVLREQQRQRQLSPSPSHHQRDELLAAASLSFSEECQEIAYITGYNDEVAAYAGASAVQTQAVNPPKRGYFSGFAKQVRALADSAFLERQSKGKR